MHRRIIRALALLLCVLASLARGETVIRIHEAGGRTEAFTVSLTEDFPEDSTARRLAGMQIISQRDPRFADASYRYIRKAPFEKNGCGPAALHNGLAVTLGIDDPEQSARILLEIMTLLAPQHNPAQNRLNYDRAPSLIDADAETAPALAALMETCPHRTALTGVTADKAMACIGAGEGDVFLIGRFNLNADTVEIVRLADALCEAGYPDAVIAVAAVSAGGSDSHTPFGLGEEGHFITVMFVAGEFREKGTIYVLDSYPRAIRNENLNDVYTSRYYFAANSRLTSFRVNYDVTRVSPTVLMCTLREDAAAELAGLREKAGTPSGKAAYDKARARYAAYVRTFGTGTLMVRVFRRED